MKTVISNPASAWKISNPASEWKYPCLKQFSEHETFFVVLFSERDTGTVVARTGTARWALGHFSNEWAEKEFKPYYSTITLSND